MDEFQKYGEAFLKNEQNKMSDPIKQIAENANQQELEHWKVLQDTQKKVFEIRQDASINLAKTEDKMFGKWEEAIRNKNGESGQSTNAKSNVSNNTFTASDFSSLQASAQSVFNDIVNSIKSIQASCYNISSIVNSGDSQYSSRWSNVGNSFEVSLQKAAEYQGIITRTMTDYISKTVDNETQAEADLSAIDDEIANLIGNNG